MISDCKIFSLMLLRQLNFGILSVYQPFYVYYKGKTLLFFNYFHREQEHSNKTPVYTKSMNMDIGVVRTSNQLSIRRS